MNRTKIEWCDLKVSDAYVAGFFDGEGSAMVLTVKRIISGKLFFRLRPTIKIAQNTKELLELIRIHLGYGTVVGKEGQCYSLQINGNKNIISFVDTIAPYTCLKSRQLLLLRELAIYQDINFSNTPYNFDAMNTMLDMRDAVFEANTWTRSKIKQKYPKGKILAEHEFVDLSQWQANRNLKGITALNKYAQSQKLPRNKVQCECGCGASFITPDKNGKIRRFIRGHNGKKEVVVNE